MSAVYEFRAVVIVRASDLGEAQRIAEKVTEEVELSNPDRARASLEEARPSSSRRRSSDVRAEPRVGLSMRIFCAIAFALVALSAVGCTAAAAPQSASYAHVATRATVAYAVDGDTLRVELASGDLTYVRLVGIDTPEDVRPGYPTECGARAAAASMDRLAPEGVEVTLRPDSVAGPEDRYGRLLAHAFIGGRQLEIAQLRRGLAYVYRYDGQRFDGLPRFETAEHHARGADIGVWRRCGGDFHSAAPGLQN